MLAVGLIGLLIAVLFRSRGPGAVQTAQPSGVLAPSPISTGPAPAPSPTAQPQGAPAGESIELAGGAVTVPVPEGWEASATESGNGVNMFSSEGDYIFVNVFEADPSAEAAQIVVSSTEEVLTSGEGYSQVQMTEVEPLQPEASIVSAAIQAYAGVYTDDQGSADVEGRFFAFIRQDGIAMLLWIETPQGEFEAHESLWSPVASGAINSFAGG